MKLRELLENLQELVNQLPSDDVDPDVLIVTQPSYPFEYSLAGVAQRCDLPEFQEKHPEEVCMLCRQLGETRTISTEEDGDQEHCLNCMLAANPGDEDLERELANLNKGYNVVLIEGSQLRYTTKGWWML